MQYQQIIEGKYPILPGQLSSPYLPNLTHRLRAAFPDEYTFKTPAVIILRTPNNLALSVPDGPIYISTGLISRLSTEAELAFVIAHELSHSALKHSDQLTENADENTGQLADLELEADQLAVIDLVRCGFDPYQAIEALSHVYWNTKEDTDGKTHPQFIERSNRLLRAINKSGWRPPGIRTTRAYNIFREQIQ